MRVLIVSPHADDEVIGCGGMVARRKNDTFDLLIMALEDSVVEQADVETRQRELEASCRILGISKAKSLFPEMSNRLDTVWMSHIVRELDKEIEAGCYDEIYIPAPVHFHDHRVVHEACWAAMRPGAHDEVNLVAMYDNTWPGWWTPPPWGKMYFDISETLDVKGRAMLCYKSQLERHDEGHPISIHSIMTLAKTRGMEAGMESAELYYVMRWKR